MNKTDRINETRRILYSNNPEKYLKLSAQNQKENGARWYLKRKKETLEKFRVYKQNTPAMKGRKPWTEEDVNFLTSYHNKMTITELAQKLCRSYAATSRKLCLLRLLTNPHRHTSKSY